MRLTPLLAGVGLTATALLATPVAAQAAWNSGGSGPAVARATTLPAGPTPTVAVSNGSSVKISWTPTSVAAGAPVRGFQVVRTDESTGHTTPAERGCAGVFTDTTHCTEATVPPGRWTYGIVLLVGDNWISPPGFAPTVQVKPPKQLLTVPPPNPGPTPSASPSASPAPSSSPSEPPPASPTAAPSPSAPAPRPSASPSPSQESQPSEEAEASPTASAGPVDNAGKVSDPGA